MTITEGRIASAPTDGRVDVVIPTFDAEQRFNDCPYMPRGTDQPTPGARCLVVVLDKAAWVPAWESG